MDRSRLLCFNRIIPYPYRVIHLQEVPRLLQVPHQPTDLPLLPLLLPLPLLLFPLSEVVLLLQEVEVVQPVVEVAEL